MTPQKANNVTALKKLGEDGNCLECGDWYFIVDVKDLHILYSPIKQPIHDIWVTIPKKVFDKALKGEGLRNRSYMICLDKSPTIVSFVKDAVAVYFYPPKKVLNKLVKWYLHGVQK